MAAPRQRQALPIYVINLDRAEDRWAAMQGSLNHLGLVSERVSAFDGRAGEHEEVSRYDEALSRRYGGAPQSETTMACFASHYRVWQQVCDSGQAALVLEDDLAFQNGFLEALALARQRIEERHYIRLFALNQKRRYQEIESLPNGLRLVRLTYRPIGAQAYLLSCEGAKRLLAHAKRWFQPVDDYLDCFWVHGLAPYAVQPYRITHADQQHSFIQSDVPGYRRSFSEQLRFKLRRRWERTMARIWLMRNPPS